MIFHVVVKYELKADSKLKTCLKRHMLPACLLITAFVCCWSRYTFSDSLCCVSSMMRFFLWSCIFLLPAHELKLADCRANAHEYEYVCFLLFLYVSTHYADNWRTFISNELIATVMWLLKLSEYCITLKC